MGKQPTNEQNPEINSTKIKPFQLIDKKTQMYLSQHSTYPNAYTKFDISTYPIKKKQESSSLSQHSIHKESIHMSICTHLQIYMQVKNNSITSSLPNYE
jgi:hypothetical protein